MGNIMTASQYSDLYSKDFSKIYYGSLAKEKPVFEQIANVMNLDTQYTKMSGMSGLGLIPQATGDGAEYSLDQLFQKYDKTFTPLEFKVRVRLTQVAYEDDTTGTLKMIPKLLGESSRMTAEQEFANLFDRSQTAAYTGADGKVLCATDHPLSGGNVPGTFSNRPSTNATVTLGAIEDGIIAYKTTVNDRNIRNPKSPVICLVPAEQEINIRKILESKETLTADKIDNIVNKMGLRHIVNPYLSQSKSWYLIGNKEDVQLFFMWRVKPSEKMDIDPDTDDILYKTRMRFVTSWLDPRNIYGSIVA